MTATAGASRRRRDQPPPQTGASEREVLLGFVQYLRESAAGKVEGVPEPAVRTPGVESGTNLLGLIKHLTHVERWLFLGAEVKSWPATFRATKTETAEGILQAYRDTAAEVDAVVTRYDDLAAPAPRGAGKTDSPSLRWALTHLVEETARHAGHLDIIREQLDGSTGR